MGNLIWFVIVGAISGWLANSIMKRGEKGFLRNMLLGVVGVIVGGNVFKLVGLSTEPNIFGMIITSVAGAVLVIWIVEKIRS